MSYSLLLEIVVSLSAQVALLIGLTAWLTRRQRFAAHADTCWSALHTCILLLTLAAFIVPHVRFVTWADLLPSYRHQVMADTMETIGRYFAWMWLCGGGVVLGLCAAGMMRATALVRRAVVDRRIGRLGRGGVTAGASPLAQLETRVTPDGLSPFCWQFHRPVIVLPKVVRQFPKAEQAAIYRHECAHLRLQHPLHLFLQRVVEAIYWFHPLVWWASRQAATARELRCDRDSVRSKHEIVAYLRSLLRLIEAKLQSPGKLPAGIGFLGNTSLLTRRAQQLGEYLEQSAVRAQPRRAALAIVVGTLACGLLWLPINPDASRRSRWSPWPTWSAQALDSVGLMVRDYEVDGHRLVLPSNR